MCPNRSDTFGILDNRFLSGSLGLLDPPPPLILPQESKVIEAIQLLQEHKLGSVALTDVSGKLTGIFTERDVLLKVSLKPIDPKVMPLSKLMTANPQTASMTTTIAFALNMMSQGGYRHLPVVDDDHLPVGIISVKDLIDYIAKSVTKDLAAFGM